MHSAYGADSYESQHVAMTPQIIAEEFVETAEEGLPNTIRSIVLMESQNASWCVWIKNLVLR